jgi:fatty-acyl-CoA synthase
MATYKAPRLIEFMDALPRTASGKLMWRALQEREWEREQEQKREMRR